MFRIKSIEERLATRLAMPEDLSGQQSYRALVWRRFRKNRLAVWSLRALYVLLFVAVFADFLANEKPIICKLDGNWYFPVLKQYAVDAGLGKWEERFLYPKWQEYDYEFSIKPPIPYSATFQDRRNTRYKAPFGEQRIESNYYRHWLGTDAIGRDVAAGMIHGTRIAMLVGVIAMSIATVIGIFFGALAGYFGDSRLQITPVRVVFIVLAVFIGGFYAFGVRSFALEQASEQGRFLWEFGKSLFLFTFILVVANGLAGLLERKSLAHRRFYLPLDLLVMRLIEIVNSIPALLLLLATLAVLSSPSILYVMVIIGLIGWTGIARFMRAELLRIRGLPYIEAAQAMGFREARTLFRHAIPNALTPVLITIAFGIASAILLEASLSFLGIGVDARTVTWGSMLQAARNNINAWWLAIFPGLAIFITVTIFNLIGEGITEALDPKS